MMETLTLETKATPRVTIESIDGDLRLVGQPGRTFEVQAPSKGQISLRQEAERIELSCRAGCLVFLPADAAVEARAVAGDLHLTGIEGQSSVMKVEGDARLRRAAQVKMGKLDGDLSVDDLKGELRVDSVDGDADVRNVRGDVHLGRVGGDLRLRRVDGDVEADVEGDASARLAPAPDSNSWIHAGGDIMAVLPSDASAVVRVTAGGEVLLPNPSERVVIEGPGVVCCGSGSASVELKCDGDLSLRLGGLGRADRWGPDLQEQIHARVNTSIAKMEASLEELGLDSMSIDSERISQRVRRAVDRALRAAAGGAGVRAHRTAKDRPDKAGESQAAVGDEEHLAVLRMLEGGKINAEQAEALLRALEEEG
jgi:hypothetical protein